MQTRTVIVTGRCADEARQPNGEPRIDKVFALAGRADNGGAIPRSEIRAALDPFVR